MNLRIAFLAAATALATAAAACGDVADPMDTGGEPDGGTTSGGGTDDPDAAPVEEDVDPPETTFDVVPPDPSNSRSGTIEFSSSEPDSTFMCHLGVGDFAPCASPFDFALDGDGAVVFEVYAIDAAGNADPTPAMHAWVVDTIAPVVTVSSGPANPTNLGTATLEFSADELATFECRVDSGAFASCSSPATFNGLADGDHQFDVRATDLAGNVGTGLYGWAVDAAAPSLSITSTPANPTNSTSAAFVFSAEAGTTVTCRIDGGSFGSCDSATTHAYSGLAANTAHTFEVRAVDGAGNDAVASYTWNIDTIAPVVSILNKPNNPTNVSSAAFTFSVNEAAAVQCRRDSASYGGCDSATSHSYSSLTDGSHTFYVRATDAAGNQGVGSYPWSIDTTPPNTRITEAPASTYPVDYATFRFSADEAGATFQCSINGGAFTACSSPKGYNGLGYAAHSFRVRAVDALNNADASPAQHDWTAQRGLILHYPMERSLANASPLGAAHDGGGNGLSFVAGRVGRYAVAFDGTAGTYAKLAETSRPMANDEAYTLAMYFRDLEFVIDGEVRELFNFYDAAGGGIMANRLWSRAGELPIAYITDRGVTEKGSVIANGSQTWQHVALVYDGIGADVDVYVNAVLVASIPNTRRGHIYNRLQMTSMLLGRNSFFAIDDVRVYNLALSNQQICEDIMGRLWVDNADPYCK